MSICIIQGTRKGVLVGKGNKDLKDTGDMKGTREIVGGKCRWGGDERKGRVGVGGGIINTKNI